MANEGLVIPLYTEHLFSPTLVQYRGMIDINH